MHTVPGLFERLSALYAEGERALHEGRLEDAVARFTEGLGLDDEFRNQYVTMYAQRAFARQRLGDHMGCCHHLGGSEQDHGTGRRTDHGGALALLVA